MKNIIERNQEINASMPGLIKTDCYRAFGKLVGDRRKNVILPAKPAVYQCV